MTGCFDLHVTTAGQQFVALLEERHADQGRDTLSRRTDDRMVRAILDNDAAARAGKANQWSNPAILTGLCRRKSA